MRARAALLGVLLAIAAGAPAAMAATTRYVKQGGATVFPNACTQGTPCDITAINGNTDTTIVAGDTIVVLSSATPITLSAALAPTKALTITGDPASLSRPIIQLAANSAVTLVVNQNGTIISHLDLRETGATGNALSANGQITISDVLLSGTYVTAELNGGAALSQAAVSLKDDATQGGNGVRIDGAASVSNTSVTVSGASTGLVGVLTSSNDTISDVSVVSTQDGVFTNGLNTTLRRLTVTADNRGALVGSGDTLTDSLIRTTGPGAAVTVSGGTALLRNLTAISPGGPGLEAKPAIIGGGATIDARNVIARGGGTAADVVADPAAVPCVIPPCVPGAATIAYSNYRTASPGGGVTDAGHNQSGDPLFVSSSDFHLQALSPAVDAGISDPAVGTTDLDGQPRVQGNAPDLGAYESPFTAPGPIPGPGPEPTPTPIPTPIPAPPPTPDRTAPTLTHVSLTHTTFAVAGGATAVSAKHTKKAPTPRGTALRFTLSEPATVVIALSQRTTGRRSGTKCVKATRALRHRKSCALLVSKGTLTRRGLNAGAQSIAFTGRVGTRAAPTGSYEAAIVATDAAGNHSTAVTAHFTIVRGSR